jgi:hypothetical protein
MLALWDPKSRTVSFQVSDSVVVSEARWQAFDWSGLTWAGFRRLEAQPMEWLKVLVRS